MSNEELDYRITVTLEEIKREHAEHERRIADREAAHTKWMAGLSIGILVSGIVFLASILFRVMAQLP